MKTFRDMKNEVIENVDMQDREQQVFVLAGLLAFTDKVIDEKTAEE